MSRPDRTIILDARAMSRALQRMAVEVLRAGPRTDDLVLIGIQRRGVELAERIAKLIEQDEGAVVPRGALDITLYRDDLETVGPSRHRRDPHPRGAHRQARRDRGRRALHRPHRPRRTRRARRLRSSKRISLCVLVDRGGRELPIQPDIVGKQVKVNRGERVMCWSRSWTGATRWTSCSREARRDLQIGCGATRRLHP